MKCEKCGGEWIPPKDRSVSLMNCPFCGTPILSAEKAGGYTDMGEFLAYLVSLYGAELYKSCQKLNNLIADLYQGDERLKRAYRRAIMDDTLAQRIYELSLKPLNEREAYRNQIAAQFSDANFYSSDFGKQIVDSFTSGLRLEILPPIISTVATEEDGEWIDEFGVVYSADRRKLIKGNKDLTNYTVKEGTVVICDEAFRGCCSLKVLTLPTSVTNIGGRAFPDIGERFFPEYNNFTLHLDGIGHFVIRDDILYTADLKEVIWCHELKRGRVVIPNTVTSIGDRAFERCSSLISLTLPASVTNIGGRAFPEYENFTLHLEGTGHFVIKDDILYTADLKKVIWCPASKRGSVVIPDTVTSIENRAFSGCRFLCSLTLPTSLTSIGNSTFSGCSSLRSLTLPTSLTSIGDSAFSGCSSLRSLTLPSSLTSIGDSAFKDCHSLRSLTLPSSLTSSHFLAFIGCSSLRTIYIPIGTMDKFKRLLPGDLHDKLKEI